MGLFGRKRFNEMPTAEERYRAEQEEAVRERLAQGGPTPSAVQQESSRRWKQRRAATAERRKKILKAGTLNRRGNTVILEGNWQLATDKLPEGDLSSLVALGKLGDLTVQDFHAMAENHGPDCGCGLGRRTSPFRP
ncbi:hypothetical protein ABT390_33975 [Streptomyces aurantiacus]|uniref:Uncharacterized protein n=1 Tax=Streptomyces aurantiacus JA 4570 TaxID=1286094 RepID=S3ZUK6_9ACTN|nr:hypothetical protein [Streptomyces aurantiacus]EPH46873.1 hypothetical protein STRAU_0039 [Streptomyces aurantiacus JA 4570]